MAACGVAFGLWGGWKMGRNLLWRMAWRPWLQLDVTVGTRGTVWTAYRPPWLYLKLFPQGLGDGLRRIWRKRTSRCGVAASGVAAGGEGYVPAGLAAWAAKGPSRRASRSTPQPPWQAASIRQPAQNCGWADVKRFISGEWLHGRTLPNGSSV